MKKIVGLIGGLACMAMVLLSACEKEPLHDSIEQHWRLECFTLVETGEKVVCRNLFMGITRMVTEVAEKPVSNGLEDVSSSQGYGSYMARTSYRDNGTKLVLSDFKVGGYNTDEKMDATAQQLQPFGINNPVETVFQVVEVEHDRLILESDYARLELKRF